jgi:hypothetical protein
MSRQACPKCSKLCNSAQSLHFHFTSKSQSNEKPWDNGDEKLCRELDKELINDLKAKIVRATHPVDARRRDLERDEPQSLAAVSADEFRAAVRRLFSRRDEVGHRCVVEPTEIRGRKLVPFFVECTDGFTLLMCAKQLSSTANILLLAPYAPSDGVNDELDGWRKDDVVCQVYELDENDGEAAEDLSGYLVSASLDPGGARSCHVVLHSLCIY